MTSPVPASPFRARWARWAPLLVGILALFAAWGQLFFLRWPVYGGLVIVVLFCSILIRRTFRTPRAAVAVAVVAALGVVGQLGWMLAHWYPAAVIAQVSTAVVAFACFLGRRSRRAARGAEGADRSTRGRRLLRSTATAGLLTVATIVSLALITISVVPASLGVTLQSLAGQTSSFTPRGPEGATTVTDNGDRLTSDISYGSEYPNSFLDLYIADDDPSIARPTYVYIHGGGWVAGSKSTGDPNAPGGGFSVIADPVTDAGYNFVSLDYALAPTASDTEMIEQISQAVSFLQDNAERLGLDMNDVVVGGGSAGGQLAGQFANVQTNAAYAERIGVDPVLESALKAVVLDSAALELDKAGETQAPVPLNDFLFGVSARAFVGTSESAMVEASVTDHVTADFPPAFIADGNDGTFPDQASALHDRLDELGVSNAVFLPSAEEATLGHGFMGAAGSWTDAYNAKKLEFLASLGL